MSIGRIANKGAKVAREGSSCVLLCEPKQPGTRQAGPRPSPGWGEKKGRSLIPWSPPCALGLRVSCLRSVATRGFVSLLCPLRFLSGPPLWCIQCNRSRLRMTWAVHGN
ncbi:Hypothetical protein NTJ_08501 [Nesidiocoris tenuis]|uniref:Uncharacterized protein n=1 Tax=Nesidiocoris tenuis TaxID=355587 RepID=A0ABN7AU23_9HEMI|nr:Hypothetical protein NTJ_08501 [Nesidiocoris tenuis]